MKKAIKYFFLSLSVFTLLFLLYTFAACPHENSEFLPKYLKSIDESAVVKAWLVDDMDKSHRIEYVCPNFKIPELASKVKIFEYSKKMPMEYVAGELSISSKNHELKIYQIYKNKNELFLTSDANTIVHGLLKWERYFFARNRVFSLVDLQDIENITLKLEAREVNPYPLGDGIYQTNPESLKKTLENFLTFELVRPMKLMYFGEIIVKTKGKGHKGTVLFFEKSIYLDFGFEAIFKGDLAILELFEKKD